MLKGLDQEIICANSTEMKVSSYGKQTDLQQREETHKFLSGLLRELLAALMLLYTKIYMGETRTND